MSHEPFYLKTTSSPRGFGPYWSLDDAIQDALILESLTPPQSVLAVLQNNEPLLWGDALCDKLKEYAAL
jgi:hypothetical protein